MLSPIYTVKDNGKIILETPSYYEALGTLDNTEHGELYKNGKLIGNYNK